MFPKPFIKTDFLIVDLYTVFLCLGVAMAIVVYRIFADKKKINWRVQQLTVILGAVAIFVGYYSAVLFQALYNIAENGKFIINQNTGATFYGGLIGGAASFLALYFGVGHFLFKENKEHIKHLLDLFDIGAASIAIAHSLGRVGCLMAGCCHGGVTDAWYGIYMPALGAKVVPLQLFEAVFLAALFAFFVYRILKGKSFNLPIYMAFYGVWRFVIEFFRADDRGSTLVDFLSPSQLIALLMIIGATALYFGQRIIMKKIANMAAVSEILSEVEDDIAEEAAGETIIEPAEEPTEKATEEPAEDAAESDEVQDAENE